MFFWSFLLVFVIGLIFVSAMFWVIFKKDEDLHKLEWANRGSGNVERQFEEPTK
jgi:hypothetical protein